MKRADFILTGMILIMAGVLFLISSAKTITGGAELVITVDGEEFGRYDLRGDAEIKIGDHAVCRIRNERVSMTEADCPDKLCVHSAEIGREGGAIVCLPNKIILKIEGTGQTAPDAIAG